MVYLNYGYHASPFRACPSTAWWDLRRFGAELPSEGKGLPGKAHVAGAGHNSNCEQPANLVAIKTWYERGLPNNHTKNQEGDRTCLWLGLSLLTLTGLRFDCEPNYPVSISVCIRSLSFQEIRWVQSGFLFLPLTLYA